MSKSGAFPLYTLVIVLNVIFIVLSVFKRWSGEKDKIEDDDDNDERSSSRGKSRSANDGLTYRYMLHALTLQRVLSTYKKICTSHEASMSYLIQVFVLLKLASCPKFQRKAK